MSAKEAILKPDFVVQQHVLLVISQVKSGAEKIKYKMNVEGVASCPIELTLWQNPQIVAKIFSFEDDKVELYFPS